MTNFKTKIVKENKISQETINNYLTLQPQIKSIFLEMKDLSTKKPEITVNKFKMTIINSLISAVREILKTEEEFKYLNNFSDDDLPQNSDVVLLLAQYMSALNQFESTYFFSDSNSRFDMTWHMYPNPRRKPHE